MPEIQIFNAFDSPGRAPAGLAWDGDHLWLNDYQSGMLYQLNPDTGKAISSLLCAGVISGLTWDGRFLWQTRIDENWLQKVNPEKHDIDHTVAIEGYHRLSDLAWDGRNLWIVSQTESKLLNVNSENGLIHESITIPTATTAVTYHNGYLWLAYAHQMRFNPDSDNFEWLSDEHAFYLLQLNPADTREKACYRLGFLPMGLEWVGDTLWLSHAGDGRLFCGQLS